MKTEELRIGNYMQYRDKSRLLQVCNIGLLGFETVDENGLLYGSDDILDYNPISLTEEWLFDFGFKNTEIGVFEIKVLSRGSINIHTNRMDIKFVELGTTGHYLFGVVDIKYVHQLQNLYFALTGKELTIKVNAKNN